MSLFCARFAFYTVRLMSVSYISHFILFLYLTATASWERISIFSQDDFKLLNTALRMANNYYFAFECPYFYLYTLFDVIFWFFYVWTSMVTLFILSFGTRRNDNSEIKKQTITMLLMSFKCYSTHFFEQIYIAHQCSRYEKMPNLLRFEFGF